MNTNTVMHVYPNVCMSNGHDGLAIVAKKENKVNVRKLRVGEFALFINRGFTACKLVAANNIVLHYKHPKGHRLEYAALTLIPHFYNGQNIEYTKALDMVIRKNYPYLFEHEKYEKAKETTKSKKNAKLAKAA